MEKVQYKQISIDVKLTDGFDIEVITNLVQNEINKIVDAEILGETVNDVSEFYLKDKIMKYIDKNGSGVLDDLIELYDNDAQFVEAVENDYDLFDYDAWKHFQKLIGVNISFDKFIEISSLLYEEDIEVMELPYSEGAEQI